MSKVNVPHINRVILSGRLTADPDTRTTQSGISMATFTIAVDTPKRNSDNTGWEDPETLFIRITSFSHLAEKVISRLEKGSPAIIEGRLQSYKYEKDGEEKKGYNIIAAKVYPLQKKESYEEFSKGEILTYKKNDKVQIIDNYPLAKDKKQTIFKTSNNEDDGIPF